MHNYTSTSWLHILHSYSTFALRVRFGCQEWSRLRLKRPNWISNYVVIRFIRTRHYHFGKYGIVRKNLCFCVPDKTIHSQAKYIIINYCDQEARLLVSRLCYGTKLSYFVIGLSEWTIMNIRAWLDCRLAFQCQKELWLMTC